MTLDTDLPAGESWTQKHIKISGDANFQVGSYEIIAQDGPKLTLDRSPAPTSTTGGAWSLLRAPIRQQPSPNPAPLLLLHVDFEDFLSAPLKTYLTDPPQEFHGVVARLFVRPEGVYSAEREVTRCVIANNLAAAIQDVPPGRRVAVISAESLRACGEEISYRVTWERAIMDAYRVVQRYQSMPSASSIDFRPLG